MDYSRIYLLDIIQEIKELITDYQDPGKRLETGDENNVEERILQLTKKCGMESDPNESLDCKICGKRFLHYRQLGGHMSLAHKSMKTKEFLAKNNGKESFLNILDSSLKSDSFCDDINNNPIKVEKDEEIGLVSTI